MNERRVNWPLWIGFLLTIAAFLSYLFVFARFPITRDLPWVNFILFAVAIALLIAGVRRAYATPSTARRVISSIVALLGTVVTAFFLVVVLVLSRDIPAAPNAPAVGQKAPDFTLPDTNGNPVALAQLLTAPVAGHAPAGVLLIFYRGYW